MRPSLYSRKFIFGAFAALFLVVPAIAFGAVGVGVGVGIGKVVIDKPLKAGGIYSLPDLPVLNTGDERGDYQASIQYLEGVPQMWPPREWFSFSPETFSLDPGGVQQVKVTLTIPLHTTPGDYFAYLEAHPIKKSVAGQTSIGVAAAAKLYFTVAPANIFEAIYYRITSLYSRYHPWDTIALGLIALILIVRFFAKRFKFQIAKK